MTKLPLNMQQEGISRDQLSERFKTFGWIPNPTNIDLGEDFIVHILVNAEETGIVFHLQEKSIIDIDERRKNDFLVYKFEIQDIFDWEKFSIPVVLVVWDIKQRLGKWILVDDAIKVLNEKKPNWRNNKKSISIYLPWENNTDDEGLTKLRERIGLSFLPYILKGKKLELRPKLTSPGHAEIINGYIEKLSLQGGIIELSGEHFSFPDWFTSWFDSKNIVVTLEAKLPEEPIYIKISATNLAGETYNHDAELRMIERNKNYAVMSNDHQKPSFRFELKVTTNPEETNHEYFLNISINNFGKSVYETHYLLNFIKGFIQSGGGKIVIANIRGDSSLLQRKGTYIGKFPPYLQGFLEITDKLCKIQDYSDDLIVYPQNGIENDDLQTISEMNKIIEYGQIKGTIEKFSVDVEKKGIENLVESIKTTKYIRMVIEGESNFRLFGKDISLGKATRWMRGTIEQSKDELISLLTILGEGETSQIVWHNLSFIEYYSKIMIDEAEKIGKNLYEKFNIDKIFLFGNLVWGEHVMFEESIELAVICSPEIIFDEIRAFCKKTSKQAIAVHKYDELDDEVKLKIADGGRLL
jgi:hypothetical protein